MSLHFLFDGQRILLTHGVGKHDCQSQEFRWIILTNNKNSVWKFASQQNFLNGNLATGWAYHNVYA
jgi:hypothetical protein